MNAPKVTPEMVRATFLKKYNVPPEVWEGMPEEAREAVTASLTPKIDRAMGDEPYFDDNVIRRITISEMSNDLKSEIIGMLQDCPTITEEVLTGQVQEGAAKLSVLSGATRHSSIETKEDWMEMAGEFFELSNSMDATTANMTVLVFAATWLGIVGDAEHWVHQTHGDVVDLLDEVEKDET